MKTHIHCLSLFVTFLEGYISGVEDYVARALLAPGGAVVYNDYEVQEYVDYLRGMEIGPKKVWAVEPAGDTLFHSLDNSDQLEEVLSESEVIVPFVSWDYTNQFKDKWGLDDSQWKTQPPEVHRKLENKAYLREICQKDWFTEYEVCHDKELVEVGEEMIHNYEKVLVRHPKKASGVGTKYVDDKNFFHSGELDQFLEEFSDESPFLVEEFFDEGEEFSIIWDVDEKRNLKSPFWTRQYIDNCVHQGNLVAAAEQVFPWQAEDTIEEIEEATKSIVEQFPYVGRVGFDLKVTPAGEWKILECNCRYGGSSYPNFTREQVGKDRCVLMHNIHPGLDNFKQVHTRFEDNNLDYSPKDRTGVFVANPFCLPEKCAAMIVAKSPKSAEAKLDQVLEVVEQ